MDEISHALGRIEGSLEAMKNELAEIKATSTTINQRVSKLEMKVVGVSSVVSVVSTIVVAKARSWLSGGC